ncbi:MAG TPA: hypothetical protein VED37_18460 [Ktedonobacteraceae bacterium]|nr:hypothetical protein [Ktedonobacteraceae bacterium]
MSQKTSSIQNTIRRESNTRLQGRRLIFAWVFWGIIAFFEVAALVYSLTGAVMQLQVLCSSSCAIQQLSVDAVKALQHAGLSLEDYIAFYITVILISTVLCYTLAAVLLWHRRDDWMALLVSLMLMSFGPGSISNGIRFSQWVGPTLASHLSSLFDVINLTILVLIFFLFPSGRFVPRWTRWFVYFVIGIEIVIVIIPRFTAPEPLIDIYNYLFIGILLSLVIAQVYRYRRVSTPSQCQQTKWVVYSLVVSITSVVALLVIFQPLPGSLLSSLDLIANLLLTLIPISFAVAMLRYRLWDIDIIINRTLVYGSLTVILALLYFGLIFAIQFLLRGIINQNNDIAIVVSTLTIAALFRPLHLRIQRVIDRRFYRRKYDAAKTLEAFSATLRNEVDLDTLREHLLSVVQETMQPAHVSLWLRESGKVKKPNT